MVAMQDKMGGPCWGKGRMNQRHGKAHMVGWLAACIGRSRDTTQDTHTHTSLRLGGDPIRSVLLLLLKDQKDVAVRPAGKGIAGRPLHGDSTALFIIFVVALHWVSMPDDYYMQAKYGVCNKQCKKTSSQLRLIGRHISSQWLLVDYGSEVDMMHARIVAAIAHQQAADPSRDACHVCSACVRSAPSQLIYLSSVKVKIYFNFFFIIYILIYL